MAKRNLFFLLISIFILNSCTSLKDLAYFQEKNKQTHQANIPFRTISNHIIAPGDILNISISTPLQTASQLLNTKDGISAIQVKADSSVEIPVLGTIKVGGLSMSGCTDSLMQRAGVYFKQPLVNIQLVSFKVTLLGEIKSPGMKALTMENSTVLDAIASAGDLTDYGNRKNIKVIRNKMVYYLDLTDIHIIESEGYYLNSNDIVYIEPVRRKAVQSNLSASLTVASFVSSISAFVTTMIFILK